MKKQSAITTFVTRCELSFETSKNIPESVQIEIISGEAESAAVAFTFEEIMQNSLTNLSDQERREAGLTIAKKMRQFIRTLED